ncbi:MAG: DUF1887 family protein [Opitutales bacterium]|nr:DUF1887 family protein [Opitutales bacterium]
MSTLIQFVSDQIWPNLIGPLVINMPNEVILFHTSDKHFISSCEKIERTLIHLGIPKEKILRAQIESDFPDKSTMLKSLICHTKDKSDIIVNLTGGTKIMSIAGYAFSEKSKYPSFYIDTQNPPYVYSFETGREIKLENWHEVTSRFNVETGLMAHSNSSPDLKHKTPENEKVYFSELTYKLFNQTDFRKNHGIFCDKLRNQFRPKKLLSGGKLRDALDKNIPNWEEMNPDWIDAGIKARLFHKEKEDLYLLHQDHSLFSSDKLKSTTENILNLIEGSWYELVLWKNLLNSKKYTEVRWSIEDNNNQEFGENDLIAFNKAELRLEFFSCKTGLSHIHPKEHIQALRNTANQYGGKFSKPHLAVLRCKDDRQLDSLKKKCREFNVGLIQGLEPCL